MIYHLPYWRFYFFQDGGHLEFQDGRQRAGLHEREGGFFFIHLVITNNMPKGITSTLFRMRFARSHLTSMSYSIGVMIFCSIK